MHWANQKNGLLKIYAHQNHHFSFSPIHRSTRDVLTISIFCLSLTFNFLNPSPTRLRKLNVTESQNSTMLGIAILPFFLWLSIFLIDYDYDKYLLSSNAVLKNHSDQIDKNVLITILLTRQFFLIHWLAIRKAVNPVKVWKQVLWQKIRLFSVNMCTGSFMSHELLYPFRRNWIFWTQFSRLAIFKK